MTGFNRGIWVAVFSAFALASCDALDTSALQEIEDTAKAARTTVNELNTRAEDVQGAINDPVGTLRSAALGATFTRTETAEPNLFVLTDLQTGCQWLATYDASGKAVSLLPRTEPAGDGARQRCVTLGRLGLDGVREGQTAGG